MVPPPRPPPPRGTSDPGGPVRILHGHGLLQRRAEAQAGPSSLHPRQMWEQDVEAGLKENEPGPALRVP